MRKHSKRVVAARRRNAMAGSLRPLVEQVRALVVSARHAATANIDTLQVLTNFEIGRLIVEHEQHGTARAEYGEYVLKELSNRLTAEFGRGFSKSNLEYMRRFFLVYQDRHPAIAQTLSGQLPVDGQPRPSPAKTSPVQKGRNQLITIAQTLSGQFTLSWSHYVFLLGINDPSERSFYEIESHQENWSLTEIKRQFDSGLYERLALSRDKKRVRKLAQEGHKIRQPADILKEPYILDFLGLEERPIYSESDLETAIIDKLQHFLLELGKGFLFEARQKRFTFGEDHYFVDLVFYNRLLRCYVLLDLKIGRLTHQDLGQMQMYVNHYDRDLKQPEENPTIGIILCKKKNEALVKITLPKKANIFASEYQLYLPSKEDLKQRLLEWTSSPV